MSQSAKDMLLAAIAKQRELKAKLAMQDQMASTHTVPVTPVAPSHKSELQTASATTSTTAIAWNAEQLQAIELGEALKPFCLVGAAGTGKTTTTKEIVRRIIAGNAHKIRIGTNNLTVGSPAVALVSYTNRAVKNLAKACRDIPEIIPNCLTIHKLLEFKPEYFELLGDDGKLRKTMQFIPTYTIHNQIHDLRFIVVDESSMVNVELFKMLHDACPNATFCFLGDLNQLKPVFGSAILGFKLLELPVVELTQVYRQAMTSPIVAFQHNYTLKGRTASDTELNKLTEAGQGLQFKIMKGDSNNEPLLCKTFADYFFKEYLAESYNPIDDIILIPYNKGFGTVGVNKGIAQSLGDHRGAIVHQVLAGREKHYYAVGDRVIYNRQEWEIQSISHNGKYFGPMPLLASEGLTRNGRYKTGFMPAGAVEEKDFSEMDLESILSTYDDEKEQASQQASHIITLQSCEVEGLEESLSAIGDINAMQFAYAISVHKSQGSEWRKVYLIITNNHSNMLSRELLYTGMTRAKEELVVISSPQSRTGKRDSSISKSILRQSIPGTGWREKAESFKGKYEQYEATMAGE